jgi:hypothetical protein
MDYIIENINRLNKKEKIEIVEFLCVQDNIRERIKEKGKGLELNLKYLSKELLCELYNKIKMMNETNELIFY